MVMPANSGLSTSIIYSGDRQLVVSLGVRRTISVRSEWQFMETDEQYPARNGMKSRLDLYVILERYSLDGEPQDQRYQRKNLFNFQTFRHHITESAGRFSSTHDYQTLISGISIISDEYEHRRGRYVGESALDFGYHDNDDGCR